MQKARSSEEIAALLRPIIGPYLEIFAKLHSLLSSHPIPPVPKNAPQAHVVRIINEACERDTAIFIANSLVLYLGKRGTSMTGLRAIAMEMFTQVSEQGPSWPIIEWIESDETHNVAIFHVDEEQWSWIMHSGLPTADGAKGDWEASRVDWNVSDSDHLKILFGVARHTYGISQWDQEDILKIYCDREFGNCSIEEYISHRRTGANHKIKTSR